VADRLSKATLYLRQLRTARWSSVVVFLHVLVSEASRPPFRCKRELE
jgi:hypothetical protein